MNRTVRTIGERLWSRYSTNQLVLHTSLALLWPLVFGLTLGSDIGVSAASAQLYSQLVWLFTGIHILMAMHLDQLIFVVTALGLERARERGNGVRA